MTAPSPLATERSGFGRSTASGRIGWLASCPRNTRYFVAIKMGRRQGGPSRTALEGAYLNRYVTNEQRSRRPIFIATLWAGASWLFFRVARSTRMTRIWALLPPVRLGPRLEKQPTDLRQNTSYFGDRTLDPHLRQAQLVSEVLQRSTVPKAGTSKKWDLWVVLSQIV
jgi:hypothetical protein